MKYEIERMEIIYTFYFLPFWKKVIKNLFTGARRNRYLDFLRVVPVEPRSARYANGLNYILTNHRLTH